MNIFVVFATNGERKNLKVAALTQFRKKNYFRQKKCSDLITNNTRGISFEMKMLSSN